MTAARMAGFVGLLALMPTIGKGQAADCTGVAQEVRDACLTAVDLFVYMTPQLGVALTGGNTVLVQGGAIGSFPRFTLGGRANVLVGSLPTIQTPSVTGPASRTVASPYPTIDEYLVLPTFEIALGIFPGMRKGSTRVGALDVIGNAAFMPTVRVSSGASEISVTPATSVQAGFGARVGLLQETTILPGIGISGMWRALPKTLVTGSAAGDSLRLHDTSLQAISWRLTAGKSFVLVRVAAGVGQDYYDSEGQVEAIVNQSTTGRVTTGLIPLAQSMTRNNAFVDLALNLPWVRLVAENGVVFGGDARTANVFDIDADVARTYGSVGIRIPF